MSLSEHERRELERIERELAAEEPRLAEAVRDPRGAAQRRARRDLKLAALLAVGALVKMAFAPVSFTVGLVGVAVLLGAALLAGVAASTLIRTREPSPRADETAVGDPRQ